MSWLRSCFAHGCAAVRGVVTSNARHWRNCALSTSSYDTFIPHRLCMNKGKKSLVALGALAAFGIGTWGVQTTFAAEAAESKEPMAGLVQAIAAKFNVNEADVQAVVDAERQKMEEKHAENFKSRLERAVTDGKLTRAQADAIIAKQAEEKAFFDSLKDKTEAERQAALKAHMADLKAWVENNKIPKDFAFFGFGRSGHIGRGPMGPKGEPGVRGEHGPRGDRATRGMPAGDAAWK